MAWWAESCDDGNAELGDGCDAGCQLEPGWACAEPGQACRLVVCGDGFQDAVIVGGTGGAGGTGGGGSSTGGAAGSAGGSGGGSAYFYEGCDDGNTQSDDGCTSSCEVEDGYWCGVPNQPCRQVICGDGVQDYYFSGGQYAFEYCDDGNTIGGDGCSASCEREAGWICDSPGMPCRQPVCGDGHQDFIGEPGSGGAGGGTGGGTGGAGGMSGGYYEPCDDGNTQPGDGCDATCEVEPGWVCDYYGCRQPVCGDGMADWPAEECDDGNDVAGDGCDTCTLEPWPGTGGTGIGGTGGAAVGGTGGVGAIGGTGFGGTGGA